ncbi:MAG: lipid IV(A) 3-deoxy-D-manno-octulosonic acid transferase [Gammaproteobacteria bacterium]|nr:lipid IV(A) 3-deoxy-D-manno-octulosonic acid transferase [Gammaproteobacteria bacterium]
MRILYTVIFYLILPFIFLRLLWRSRRAPAYRKRWAERLGYGSYQLDKSIWIHAVSLGESIAATPFIKALQERYPLIPIVVTNMTPTGSAHIQKTFGNTVLQQYVPYDLPFCLQHFLKRARPLVAIIVETELWPNLFYVCQKNQIPIFVVNARLSQASAAGYSRVKRLTQQMLSNVHTIAVQTESELQRFIELGLESKKGCVSGSIKFDITAPRDLISQGAALRDQLGYARHVWIAASTHAGEEEIIFAAHKKILTVFPTALLIIVPRHPERFNSVFALAQSQHFRITKRSEKSDDLSTAESYLCDSVGEMMLMYAASDVAFVAGSFADIGGHNMLEPAVLAKAIVTGPTLYNFAEISEMLINKNGMVTVQDAEELSNVVIKLFQDENYRKTMGENAEAVVVSNRGALAKQLAIAKDIIDARLAQQNAL